MLIRGLIFCGLLMCLSACWYEEPTVSIPFIEEPEESTSITIQNDTLLKIDFEGVAYDVLVRVPDGEPIGTIVALHGWNFPIADWCDSTELCEKALELGYVIVFPDMGKSIYSLRTYPETREDWLKYPTRPWLTEKVFKILQSEFNVLMEGENNYVLGLSTGGRGAYFLAKDHPEVFTAAACLSGDYDMTMAPNDNLYRGFFGEYKEHQDRWGGEENPLRSNSDLKVPVYFGHGGEDKIVPVKHSSGFAEILKMSYATTPEFRLNPDAGHDYAFWNSEVDYVLEFFNKHKSK
ncbi:MAG: alpha/beta hydrolase-fold protein [Crocinitomicaceae bacterium]|nr:alpha/beta hydrolase-fold protein [Crocinitomicaceae bacterium]